ncbi:PREDICTED: protein regulator of cytokinesis 1-like [Papilio xuthus]|uniref:Protein regulator of cytokinesis 1 n=1 Tax=Papilio xuthus TaxID=66420 RepID=A0A194PNC1_PAPXU|nr:PREDICTED: protein regulator of cytokinesis 1-like [Papilio xuthus]KPI92615.1 Protein regulator of cytokinesis 1 [Papilio xuthus]
MVAITEDVRNLFNEVLQEISQNIYHMMEELWTNWSHLGVDNAIKISNITKLVQIEKDLHREVILETQQKFKTMQSQIDKLKEETEELSRCLSVDITIMDFKEDMLLFDYKKELENQIAGYREQVLQRRMKMERLLEWQKDIGEKLGTTIYELQDVPLPSEEELDKLKNHLEVLQAERDKRVEIFLNTQVEIKDIMEKLHIKPQNKFEQLVVSSLSVDFKVTDLNMDRLAKLQQDLQDKYQQTNNRVLELRERLAKLWDCLEEDHIYRENFLQAHIGCNPDTENALKEEIRRCDQIKRQKIQVFVANVRTKIKLMWDNLMYSQKEREEFVHYYQDTFTEDVLTLHELYLEKLTKHYNEQREIFDLVATRKNLWCKMTELEARATEPGRYHNRGGQLLKEEKERKAIASNLPKIEAQIRELVTAYQERTGNTFTVDGKPLLQLMLDDWEDRKAERHNKLSARKQALTPSTPMFRSMATSPLGKRNRTAAGLASTAEKNRLPVKRQLVTGSANKAVSNAHNMSALKRTAMSTIKRRISGRLVAKAGGDAKANQVKRMLDYGVDSKTPKIAVNSNILKHKRTSHGRRSNGGRSNISSQEEDNTLNKFKNPLSETTLLTTYTDFKECIDENKISRSSMAVRDQEAAPNVRIEVFDTPKRTPRRIVQTPKMEKENIYHHNKVPNIMCTPQRLTRSKSISKLNNDGFATPQPLSAKKDYLRQNPVTPLSMKNTPNNVRRSKSQTHMARAKDLPPLL